ncbi:protoporphyrinogen oxidase HemJ [Jiella sp. MQZ9-1]|uniref:Protoporphyrinogen IX oxidase n=1 Tax=Jiella flava TaxID=2816857 RepID=A0A939G3C4_9HYPH|nr:protoporphyrinogen oxidase HemJ [Jiella flava]MBO0664319.1 protoporphyrinogen oxidase HemJ [Jiella flava]MCD2472758.1 protoporphyrinogen oxidase HemJ [Jiella flava]
MKNAMIAFAVTIVIAALMFLLVPESGYLWVKALHVFSVIAWMAGMLYLPRLFVYHADAAVGSLQSETFKVMERRLLRGIINPSMIGTWVAGVWLAWFGGWLQSGDLWIWVKVVLVLAMSGIHGMLTAATRRFAEDRNERPARYWRIVNEIPAVLLIGIIIMVVVKPF